MAAILLPSLQIDGAAIEDLKLLQETKSWRNIIYHTMCRYIVAVYTLLLHLWLLLGGGATGSRASTLLVVLLAGAKQVFELDTTQGTVWHLC